MMEWNKIDWRKAEVKMFKLQKRIFTASERGDVKAVRKLQKTLIRSWSARVLAVRRVTQDNQGKNMSGVDGMNKLSPNKRMILANNLRITPESKPTGRVMIPKANSDEKRPLGIPTINDRALQWLVKSALEPEWEAVFEPNSYGLFRSSCHDAIEAIFNSIKQKAKYVLDVDISKCFDGINHKALLKKVNTYPTLSRQIKKWLKAGVIDWEVFFPTNEGMPQGGTISPLLVNIALHGMEERIKQYADTLKGRKRDNRKALSLIRYADDFVIIHEDINVIEDCQVIVKEWLKDMGLELKSSKIRLSHTLETYQGEVGFEFLGFHIQQHKVGDYRAATNTMGINLGFKTLITPSKSQVKAHLRKIAEVIDTHKTASQAALINQLNPIIRGWSNYYSTAISKETFSELDHLTYIKLRAWAKSRGKGNINKDKYWRTVGNQNWCFSTEDGLKLTRHSDTPIIRHTKVRGEASPYNGEWNYWSKRRGEYPGIPYGVAKLIKK
ncbi:MAG: reverse transcriptase domain-containing protein [Microcoleaceae cyanobacterium]